MHLVSPADIACGMTMPAATLAKYGIAEEDDDLIPVCLGGDNASPLNHWPQANNASPGAADKDRLEARVCFKVCRDRDDGELQHYQAAFAQDWVALWRAEGQPTATSARRESNSPRRSRSRKLSPSVTESVARHRLLNQLPAKRRRDPCLPTTTANRPLSSHRNPENGALTWPI